jgi:hypothetical protein
MQIYQKVILKNCLNKVKINNKKFNLNVKNQNVNIIKLYVNNV